jgi:O-antigen/teichoic acid export membrane protein
MLVARPLAEVLIGQDLRSAAALITPWIALGAALSGVTVYYFNQVFTLGHRTDRMLLTMAVPAVANVILNLILIPRFGVLGAAWATAASFALGLAASILIGRTVMRLPIPWEALIRCGAACAVMAGVVSLIPAVGGPVELIAKAAIGGAVYAAVALTVNAAGVRDTGRRLLTAYRARGAEA